MRRAVALAVLLVLLTARPAAALSVTGTITVGPHPFGVAAAGGGLLYVANNGGSTVSIVDTATNTVSGTIAVGSGPGEIAMDPAVHRAYVANFNDATVSVVDTAARSTIASLAPGGLGVAVDTGLGRLYTIVPAQLTVFDTVTLQQVATVPAPPGTGWWAIAVDQVRHLGYLGDLSGHGVTVVDLATNTVVTTIDVGGPIRFALATDPTRGRILVATDTVQARFSVIDSNTNAVVRIATVGNFPSHIAPYAADRAYVTDAGSNDLAVVDPTTSSVTLHPIDVPAPSPGPQPSGLALVGSTVYVALSGANLLAVMGESAPVIDQLTLAPAAPKTNDTLTATVTAHDADGDTLTFSYQWTKNGSDIAGATTSTLDLSIAGSGDRGDSISVRVTAFDGSLTSAPVTAIAVIVADSSPTAVVALNTTTPTTQTILVATTSASDPDADALTFTYVWKVNSVTRRTTVTSASTDTFDLGKPGNGNKGDTVTVDVTASDGTLEATANAIAAVVAGRGH